MKKEFYTDNKRDDLKMANVEYHRQYFRSLWREKISRDNFDRVVTIPETAPLVREITPPPPKKQSKFCKSLNRFKRQFIRELKIICSPEQHKLIRKRLKEKKKAEKRKRFVFSGFFKT